MKDNDREPKVAECADQLTHKTNAIAHLIGEGYQYKDREWLTEALGLIPILITDARELSEMLDDVIYGDMLEAKKVKNKRKKRTRKMEARLRGCLAVIATGSTDRTERYRLIAELEDLDGDITNGTSHWNGVRFDFPPDDWDRQADWSATINEATASQLVNLTGEYIDTCSVCGMDVPGPHPPVGTPQANTPHYVGPLTVKDIL
jgi:hypothetical protein